MAIIYGTPAILWPKPDTSEQWLLNSTVNPSYFGADKDFNVEFTSNNTSYSIFRLGKAANIILYGSTVVCSGGNMQDAYRQITLAKPATGELLSWLEANAVRLPLKGTWVFNSTLSNVTTNLWGNANFTCNDALFKAMGYDPASRAFGYQASDGSGVIGIYNLTDNVWSSSSYRTITFTKPVKYEGNEDFVKWFIANAKPLPNKGKTLNEYTWDEISRISLADKATEYGFKVGDAKEVTLNGSVGYGSTARTFSNQKYWVYIIGINHNEAKEGKGIAFQGFKTAQTGGIDIAVTATNYGSTGSGMVMNSTTTNANGWAGSVAYKTIMPQWKACLPSDLQAVIRTTILYTDNRGNQATAAAAVTANTYNVYYLAEYEVFGSNSYANTNEPAQQAQYAYYSAGNSKIKYRSDSTSTAAHWWLRSPDCGDKNTFCKVDKDGLTNYGLAFISNAAAPCFKV